MDLSRIQVAANELFAAGAIDVNPQTVGYRSAFVGAVLARIPGVVVETNPRRAHLAPSAEKELNVRPHGSAQRPRRFALVGCVKTKLSGVHAARDLYVSPLFLRRQAYVEAAGLAWFVLSAEHGLLEPSTRISWYDRTLNRMTSRERAEWGERVLAQLVEVVGDLSGVTFEVHAGSRYLEPIARGLEAAGALVDAPTASLPLGSQLAWYDAHRVARTSAASRTLGTADGR